MTDEWITPENIRITPWLPVEPIRTGFGGLVYWRSRDTINGHHQWTVTPGIPPTKEPR
jgi:hypothetical protein